MDETGKKLLRLMFREDETVCLSPNQWGYHSVPFSNAIGDEITLVPTPESCVKRNVVWEESFEKIETSKLLLCALNPIKGFRVDQNCTAFRNFLVEIDVSTTEHQISYLKTIGIPYSALVFSGNKSVHCLVSLATDLPDEKIWRKVAEWILNICTIADQQTKNPSRSIRIPGAEREPGKLQTLLEFKGPVKLEDMAAWLNMHPEAKPKERERKPRTGDLDLDNLPNWVADRLVNGLDPTKGRSNQWYAISVAFALQNFSESDTIEILSGYFSPDRDFKEREWLTTIKSGFDAVDSGKIK